MTLKSQFYVVTVYRAIAPEKLVGPFSTYESRDQAAKEIRKGQHDEDCIFWLDIDARGNPRMGAYMNFFFEEPEEEEDK